MIPLSELDCFDEASRLACWVRDYGKDYSMDFVNDIKQVLIGLNPKFEQVWIQ